MDSTNANVCTTCTTANILICSASNVATNPTSGGCSSGYGGADCSTVCIAGGATCSTTTVALTCLNGFYNNFATTYNCLGCGLNTATCSDVFNPKTCNTGYNLDATNKVCYKCP